MKFQLPANHSTGLNIIKICFNIREGDFVLKPNWHIIINDKASSELCDYLQTTGLGAGVWSLPN